VVKALWSALSNNKPKPEKKLMEEPNLLSLSLLISSLLLYPLFEIYYVLSSIPFSLQRLVFWHQEVASDSFCLLINSPWLSVFILIFFFLSFSGFNLYCWKGIHFS